VGGGHMMNFFAWGPGGDIQVGGGHMMNSFAWGPGGDIQVEEDT